MKISKEMEKALNEQVNREFGAAYLYLSMSAHFESKKFAGMAKWMKKQSDEELEHGMKFYDYIHSRNGSAKMLALTEPKAEWKSALEAFEDALKHEQKVTALIYDLKAMAQKEGDFGTDQFLDWFVKEQVEEEQQTNEIVEKLKMIGDSKTALLMLDKHLGKRGKE